MVFAWMRGSIRNKRRQAESSNSEDSRKDRHFVMLNEGNQEKYDYERGKLGSDKLSNIT